MAYLDKRDGIKGLDKSVATDMMSRTQIGQGTDVSVQEVVNALCDILDGNDVYDIRGMTGLDEDACQRISAIRDKIKAHWTHADGAKVLG